MRSTCSAISRVNPAVWLAAALLIASPAAAQQQQQRAQRQGGAQQRTAAGNRQPAKVDLGDLSKHPDKYIGQTVTVEGETLAVLGPHLFVVDEPEWFHLSGGMLVVVPEPYATVVQSGAPVLVTGTVEKVVMAEARRKWAFLNNEPRVQVDLFEKPVIVASEVTTVAPSLVSLKFEPGQQTTGTAGGSGGTVTDIKQLSAATDNSIVGQRVEVTGTVVRTEGNGFWVRTSSGEEVFVQAANRATARAGQTVDVQGRVLETPRDMQGSKNSKGQRQPVYIYADKVAPK